MIDKLKTVARGACMGLADVVPGVSGGTMALVLGIYVQFIEAVKSVNFRWVLPLFAWIGSGFKSEKKDAVIDPIRSIHWGFLIPLMMGIMAAFVVGSRIIPELMDRYPVEMRAFFMGLIIASMLVPWAQMQSKGFVEVGVIIACAVLFYFIVGSASSPPQSWDTYEDDAAMTLEDFTRAYPSTATPEQLYCPRDANDNPELRAAIAAASPEQAAELDEVCAAVVAASGDLRELSDVRHELHLGRKHPDNPFNEVEVPEGTPINIPSPAIWFVFIAGLIAICAMVLPGISGSFILLIFGLYYFLLSAIKGFIYSLIDLQFPTNQLIYVSVFFVGTLIGIMLFTRLLSWLFKHYEAVTLAALIGIMLGSLRVIWPWKIGDTHTTEVQNVLPAGGDAALPIALIAVGFIVVFGLSMLGRRAEHLQDVHDA